MELIIAILPVILLCIYIFIKDYNKEPFNMLAITILCGALSVIPTLACELFLGSRFNLHSENLFELFFIILFCIAIIEEFFKWLVIYTISFNNKEMDEAFDGIVYAVFSSLGFALVENILYVMEGGIGTGIMRAIISIPGHASYGVIMGYFISQAKLAKVNGDRKKAVRNLLLSISVPTIIHAVYDFLLSTPQEQFQTIYVYVFLVFILSLYTFCIELINKMAGKERNILFRRKRPHPERIMINSVNNQ